MGHPVVHIVTYPLAAPHILNTSSEHACDCWCEPHAEWYRNKWGVLVLVVEHDDECLADEWIDRVLADPKQLPPHVGEEGTP